MAKLGKERKVTAFDFAVTEFLCELKMIFRINAIRLPSLRDHQSVLTTPTGQGFYHLYWDGLSMLDIKAEQTDEFEAAAEVHSPIWPREARILLRLTADGIEFNSHVSKWSVNECELRGFSANIEGFPLEGFSPSKILRFKCKPYWLCREFGLTPDFYFNGVGFSGKEEDDRVFLTKLGQTLSE